MKTQEIEKKNEKGGNFKRKLQQEMYMNDKRWRTEQPTELSSDRESEQKEERGKKEIISMSVRLTFSTSLHK